MKPINDTMNRPLNTNSPLISHPSSFPPPPVA
ncbi:hypothetical protein SBV1_600009 [Verrucomicrobia bacterium]|nr:hypothetical protein SBV1_600009 [Verrucomicrobiota bacterium]